MFREMGSRTQLLDWMAWNEVEPIGKLRRDYYAAQVVATLTNIYRDRKKYPQPFPTAAFLIQFEQRLRALPKEIERPKKDWRELKALAQVLSEMYNEEADNPRSRRRKKA